MSIVFTFRVGALSFLSIIWMLRVAVPVIGGLPGDQKHIFSNVINKNVIDNRMCTKTPPKNSRLYHCQQHILWRYRYCLSQSVTLGLGSLLWLFFQSHGRPWPNQLDRLLLCIWNRRDVLDIFKFSIDIQTLNVAVLYDWHVISLWLTQMCLHWWRQGL